MAVAPNLDRVIFENTCAARYEPTGKGDGATTFSPPVAELTSAKVYTRLAPQRIRTAQKGRAKTARWEHERTYCPIRTSRMWSPISAA